ncbi:Golgi resident protein GCP60 [Copidosoma floridanum]|uniref:Golgi resident protein GCP60 n=1 Tax=Copidosoma floridanum TaxID=29053 RepID=UPI0006C9C6B3|nr:Golgi resident protein GCP60 [Copidosoma floridanum]
MASSKDDGIEEKIAELSVEPANTSKDVAGKPEPTSVFGPHLSGFETSELYKLALNFYKEKEGKAVHLSYEEKMKLVAFTQQVSHGKYSPEKSPELGVLDVIGRDRKAAWQGLGDLSKNQAMEGFVLLLDDLCPLFRTFVEAHKRDIEEKARLKKEEELRAIEEEKKQRKAELAKKKEQEERQKEAYQRRQIQDALNQQTYYQFKAYAEQQYPGNPEQQGVLIRQLQEQHYHQYMQQLHKNQSLIEEKEIFDKKDIKDSDLILGVGNGNEIVSLVSNENPVTNNDEEEENDQEDEVEEEEQPDVPVIVPAEMWTNKDIKQFKETIKREAADAVLKVGHGETVTVRVPTHKDGSYLFWEFATDDYDIGFGVYFEWTTPKTTQVSVHISEDEDDDEDEEDYETREDLECGSSTEGKPDFKPSAVPISVIIPIYRRDSQEEVYAGSHQYPGQGIYLLKFDNSYSLWRSKKLYYRVYYTKADNKTE